MPELGQIVDQVVQSLTLCWVKREDRLVLLMGKLGFELFRLSQSGFPLPFQVAAIIAHKPESVNTVISGLIRFFRDCFYR